MLLALADCNNFFVSCERVFKPALEAVPVIVLSNNDGCVISRSNEAKALGIPMGAPFFEVRPIVVEHGVRAISANHELYVDMSRRVMALLEDYSDGLQAYSIDESFLRPPADQEPLGWARMLRAAVLRATGLPVSVGLAPTKVLAKLAADLGKKGDGAVSLLEPAARASALESLPIEKIWGLARASAEKLCARGVRTAGELSRARDALVLKTLGQGGLKIARELRGESVLPFQHAAAPRQSVTVSRSFGNPVYGEQALWAALSSFVSRAAERLRRHGLAAGRLSVWVAWRDEGRLRSGASEERLIPTDSTPSLLSASRRALGRLFEPDRPFKKAGVVLTALEPAQNSQGLLFADSDARRQSHLMGALDRVNAIFGEGTLSYGATALSRAWAPRCERRSPSYTTRWTDLPSVKAG